jgi:pimeloyl-ACP methyl ester carboxylesterase
MTMMTPVVLVHGLWHGTWCWSLVTGALAARGIPSIAVDLDGHGLRSRSPEARWGRPFDPVAYATELSPSAAVTASSAAASLVEQIRQAGGGRACVVVAHSMGGIVATAAAELAPELFAELIYITAFAPVSGIPAVSYLSTPENAGEQVSALLRADPAVTGALRLDPGDRAGHTAVRDTFFHDVEETTADAAIAMLSLDGPFGIPAEAFEVTAQRYGSVPHTYLVCTDDRVIPAALQRRFVREIDEVSASATTTVELNTSHSPFLSAPDAVAEVITSTYRAHETALAL